MINNRKQNKLFFVDFRHRLIVKYYNIWKQYIARLLYKYTIRLTKQIQWCFCINWWQRKCLHTVAVLKKSYDLFIFLNYVKRTVFSSKKYLTVNKQHLLQQLCWFTSFSMAKQRWWWWWYVIGIFVVMWLLSFKLMFADAMNYSVSVYEYKYFNRLLLKSVKWITDYRKLKEICCVSFLLR